MMRSTVFFATFLLLVVVCWGQETFSDDFSDGDAAGWIAFSDENWELFPEIADGACHLTFERDSDASLAVIAPIGAVTQFDFEASGRSGDSGNGATSTGIFAMSAVGNMIQLSVLEGETLQLASGNILEADDYTVMYEQAVNAGDGNWHTMRLAITGAPPTMNATIYWDGSQVYSGVINDVPATEASGHVGYFAYGDTVDIWMDDVTIEYTPIVTGDTFTEDFNDGVMEGWFAFSDENWSLFPTIENGACHMQFAEESEVGLAMFSPVGSVSEFSFEMQGRSGGTDMGAQATGIFAISAVGNLIEYHVIEGETLQLVAGNATDTDHDYDILFEQAVNGGDGNWHTMKLEASGLPPTIHIDAYWDGVLVYSGDVTDVPANEASGHIGFFAYGDTVDMVFDNVAMTFSSTTGLESPVQQPTAFLLEQNVPNPFNPSTNLNFTVPESGMTQLNIYDINGRLVRTLLNANLPTGDHQQVWDGRDAMGHALPAGIYLARLQVAGQSSSVRMLYLK